MALGHFSLWQLANFRCGTWPIFVVALGIVFPIRRDVACYVSLIENFLKNRDVARNVSTVIPSESISQDFPSRHAANAR